MRNFKETDLFSDTSSSCSQFESSFIGKHNNFFKKENENSKKSEKIVERTPISDSDSSTYKGKMSLVDMTYEKFIEQKRSSKKTLKTTELEERIKELQRDISFNKDNKQKDYSIKKKKNSSFEEKICEKYKEIITFKESSIKKDKGFVNQEALFQELEDMKMMNKNLREKIQNQRSSNKENKTIEINKSDNKKIDKEMFLLEKIDNLRTHLNSLITKKKLGRSENKDKLKKTLQNKPLNFVKEAHCKNCSKLLSKGIPTNFCTLHIKYKNNSSTKKIF